MKIISSIILLLLLWGAGNFTRSSAQTIWQDKAHVLAKPPEKQHEELDTILNVKWMTADFTQEIDDAFPCEPVGILVQTQNIEIGQEIDVVIELKNRRDHQAVEYTVYGKVEPDHYVRIIFDQHIDLNSCENAEFEQ